MTDRLTEALPAWAPVDAALPPDVVQHLFDLRQTGRQMETIPILDAAVKQGSPHRENPNFWRALAFIHADGQQFEESKRAFWEMVQRVAPHPLAYLELCQALMACGEWHDAKLANDAALDLLVGEPLTNDRKIQTTMNAAALAYRLGDPVRGATLYGLVARLAGKDIHHDVQFAVGMARLTTHHDRRAWALHERRLDTIQVYRWSADRGEVPTLPRWTLGAQGPVVFWQEQGAGDLIQMLRYLPQIAASSGHPVIVRADPPLWPLVKAMQGVDVCVARTDDPPARATSMLPMLSAPFVFGVDGWDDVPAPIAPAAFAWTAPSNDPPRIGLCWSGAKGHPGDRDRSCPDGLVVGLVDALRSRLLARCDTIALQSGETTAGVVPMLPVASYGDTARIIQTLDAVITVDTSVAHLAGTIGVPTWCVPPCAPEWRWGLSGPSRWYPAMHVVRRTRVDGWAGAWRQVAREVGSYLTGGKR